MSSIIAVSSAFPPYYYSQEELTHRLRRFWSNRRLNLDRLESFHRNMMVKGRYLAQPLDAYETQTGFGERNEAWIKTALELGEKAVCGVLDKARLPPQLVSQLIFTTITGIAVPSIDARLMNRIPFPAHLKRMPLFGLGCLGGAAGIARAADYLAGHPQEAAIVLSIELCSLTIQHDDLSIENIISSGLFGDGAAAVLLVGSEHPLARPGLPRIVDSRSIFFQDTEHVMGWEVRDSGLKIVLSADVTEIAGDTLRPHVGAFLARHSLDIDDIEHWIAHPGGPKVMEAMENSMGLREDALQLSRESLASVGNISSTSVLLVLLETLARTRPSKGVYGLMVAMGPAFCAELVLLQW